MQNREKKLYRQEKRAKKRAGMKEKRRALRAQLENSPEDCTSAERDFEFEYGRNRTRGMNGRFRDPKRQRQEDLEPDSGTGE